MAKNPSAYLPGVLLVVCESASPHEMGPIQEMNAGGGLNIPAPCLCIKYLAIDSQLFGQLQ